MGEQGIRSNERQEKKKKENKEIKQENQRLTRVEAFRAGKINLSRTYTADGWCIWLDGSFLFSKTLAFGRVYSQSKASRKGGCKANKKQTSLKRFMPRGKKRSSQKQVGDVNPIKTCKTQNIIKWKFSSRFKLS